MKDIRYESQMSTGFIIMSGICCIWQVMSKGLFPVGRISIIIDSIPTLAFPYIESILLCSESPHNSMVKETLI
jgi:hypothetical protein